MIKILNILKSNSVFILACFIILFSSLLRVYKFDLYPLVFNSDGQSYSWVGSHILDDPFSPQGTSLFIHDNPSLFWFSHYNYYDTIRRYDFRLSDPFLDQPPFMITILGVLPKIFGYNNFANIPQGLIRFPIILLSVITLFLTYFLAKCLFGSKIALLSILIYGFTPYFVFAHRESFLENILTPIYLLGFLLLLLYLKNNKSSTFFWLVIVSMLAGFTKIVGFILPVILVLALFFNNKKKQSILLGFFSILPIIAYFIYGYLVDPSQMSLMLTMQSARGFYLASIIRMIGQPDFYEPFLDGWYVFAFISYFSFMAVHRNKKKFLLFALFTMMILLSILLTSGFYNSFFWYRYPLFPFVSMTAGWYLLKMFESKNIKMFIPFFLFSLVNVEMLAIDILSPHLSSMFRMIYIIVFFIMIVISFVQKKVLNNLAMVIMISTLLVSLVINILVVIKYPMLNCINTQCRIPEKIVID